MGKQNKINLGNKAMQATVYKSWPYFGGGTGGSGGSGGSGAGSGGNQKYSVQKRIMGGEGTKRHY